MSVIADRMKLMYEGVTVDGPVSDEQDVERLSGPVTQGTSLLRRLGARGLGQRTGSIPLVTHVSCSFGVFAVHEDSGAYSTGPSILPFFCQQ